MNHNHDQDCFAKKTCIACGRSFPATPEYFAKAGTNKRGGVILRPRCKSCYAAYTEENKLRRGLPLNDYDRGPVKHRPPFVLPFGLALGTRFQFDACPDGMGLPVLVGPGGRPVVRVAGVELHEGEVCIVLC